MDGEQATDCKTVIREARVLIDSSPKVITFLGSGCHHDWMIDLSHRPVEA